jgi:hypothetical protein
LCAPGDLETDVQLKPVVPHQRTRTAVFGKIQGQNQGRTPPCPSARRPAPAHGSPPEQERRG